VDEANITFFGTSGHSMNATFAFNVNLAIMKMNLDITLAFDP
jgi:hypothetical protein